MKKLYTVEISENWRMRLSVVVYAENEEAASKLAIELSEDASDEEYEYQECLERSVITLTEEEAKK